MTTDATMPPMSKAYNPADHESRIWQKWVEASAFSADPQRVLDGKAPAYSVLIPPPNVTAALHLGHALNNSIQDILVRAHRMKGFETLWMPGTDHAGIATQTMVDKRLKEQGKDGIAEYKKKELAGENGREEFIRLVQEFKDEFEARITHQLQTMGCSCDWERQRFTMDDICARAVREAFFLLFKDGLIYRGKRLVNWDPVTQTALADDEVEMEEVDGHFYYLRYPLVKTVEGDDTIPVTWGELATKGYPDAENHPDDEQAWITVATTRPETYMGDTGVAVNPKDPRAPGVRGLHVMLPIVGRVIPIIEDDYVVLPVKYGGEEGDAKAEMSTGFLKVTPAHDPNDYMIGQRHDLEMINIMAPDASISDQHGWDREERGEDGHIFLGKSREEARKLVIKEFDARTVAEGSEGSLLEKMVPHRHSVGHSYRSHVPVEPYLSDQWYCKVTDDKLRGNAQRALKPEQRTEASLQAWPESTPTCSSGTGFQPVSPTSSSSITIPNSLTIHQRHLPHWQLGGSTYFITFRVREGELSERERDQILDACFHFDGDRAIIRLVTVMPDHVHILLTPTEKSPGEWWLLQDLMHSIKSFTANAINRDRGANGSLWQDEYFDRLVRDHDEYVEKWNYMLMNPVKAKLADQPGEYAWTKRGEPGLRKPGSDGLEARPTREKAGGVACSNDGTMSFYPARYAKTYETWHDNLRDWCISRQLWWGHRIPVWSISNPELIQSGVLDTLESKFAGQFAYRATSGDWDDQIAFICTQPNDELEQLLESAGAKQDPDVLDTWFSSALWPLSTMGWPDASAAKDSSGIEDFESLLAAFNPTSVLTTAREIITLWVSRMTMFNRYFLASDSSGTGFQPVSPPPSSLQDDGLEARPTEDKIPGPAPFKDVFIHAMIQDGEGRKMSKTLGNGVDPLDIIDSHGADAMRFTLCQMTTQTQDVRMPVELDESTGKNTSPKFDLGRNLCNKLWNASKFALGMFEKAELKNGLPINPEELTLIDRWMLSRVTHATNKVNTALRNYMFKDYADAIYDLFWRDFCDWYLESIKPTIADSPTQAAVLRNVIDAILRLMHPVMPFITETLFERFESLPMREIEGFTFEITPTTSTLCQSGWPTPNDELRDEVAEEAYERVRSLVTAIREVRATNQVKPKRLITLHVNGPLADDIMRWSPLVETLAGVDTITADDPEGQSASFTFEGDEYRLSNLADALDAGAERDRLEKELATIEKSIAGINGRLSNPGYVDKAPAHLVQQTRDQLAQLEKDQAATKAALDKLG